MVTIVQNKMGHLHIWKGRHKITQKEKYNFVNAREKESDLYVQHDADVEDILSDLRKDVRETVENGWTVHTQNFNTDYFGTT